jgi:hypothetical protein
MFNQKKQNFIQTLVFLVQGKIKKRIHSQNSICNLTHYLAGNTRLLENRVTSARTKTKIFFEFKEGENFNRRNT